MTSFGAALRQQQIGEKIFVVSTRLSMRKIDWAWLLKSVSSKIAYELPPRRSQDRR
jgi:hypothetical protein